MITVVILTYNEELHIERCIRSIQAFASKIFIVDSFSTDKTVEIALSLGAEVVQRKWKNYSDQFHWAIENCEALSGWIMRIDADEYLEPDLQQELCSLLANIPDDVDGIYVKVKVIFQGQWIRHGGFYPLTLLRIWRTGKGRIEQRWMDEHIVLDPNAKTRTLKGHWVDNNLKGLTFWINKHNTYATREAVELLNSKYHILPRDEMLVQMSDPQAKWKRIVKDAVYSRLPAVLRALLYFIYRYFLLFGFLDGKKGFLWHFMQGFWYRLLVDMKFLEIQERGQGDVEKMRQILCDQHDITL